MQGPEKNSYKEFDNEKKFLRLENSPPPPITFLMVRPLAVSIDIFITKGRGGGRKRQKRRGRKDISMGEYLLQLPHLLHYNYYTCHSYYTYYGHYTYFTW